LFQNDLFITLLARPPKGKAGVPEKWRRRTGHGAAAEAQLARDLRALEVTCEALRTALVNYSPRLLSSYETPNGQCSEPLEFLSAVFNGELRPMLSVAADVGQHLPYRRVSFGLEAIERKGPGSAKDFAAMLSLKEYPSQATPGMLDALLRLPYELVISESFAFVDRQIALERVSLALRRQRAADDDSTSLRQGLSEAKDDLAAGNSALGEHSLRLLVRETSLERLDSAVADCASTLADLGAVAVREDLALEPAFWAQFPGNESCSARQAMISSGAFACLASLHSFPTGSAMDNHWGAPVTTLETTSGTPYFFNFHRGDLGNFTVIGPSGSGKTVVLNFLAAQAQKFSPRSVLFDKDRGSEIFVRAIGGRYASLRAGEPAGFNPLQLPDSAANRAFLREWTLRLVCKPGQTLSIEDEAVIASAVEANYLQETPHRRLRYFRELLAGHRRPSAGDIAARLAPWCGDGEHAWLFDNAEDRLDAGAATLGFDMTELLDQPVLRTPTMLYLFHRVEERLDGNPVMILIDEGWKALDDEVFSARIRDWMKTLRKRNAIVGFGTQSARDALESKVSAAIIEQSATQIFTANPRARAEDYCDGFGLSPHELELIRTLPAQSRTFLVKQARSSALVRLDLSAMPDLVIALSGRETTLRRLDELRRRRGDHPRNWWTALTGAAYPGSMAAAPMSAATIAILREAGAATSTVPAPWLQVVK
jgi:type IV secretion system protein VirB4